jgi:hypothetical protein
VDGPDLHLVPPPDDDDGGDDRPEYGPPRPGAIGVIIRPPARPALRAVPEEKP